MYYILVPALAEFTRECLHIYTLVSTNKRGDVAWESEVGPWCKLALLRTCLMLKSLMILTALGRETFLRRRGGGDDRVSRSGPRLSPPRV